MKHATRRGIRDLWARKTHNNTPQLLADASTSSPPPYFSSPPDLWILIPNTLYRLPLTWEDSIAIYKFAKCFARLYLTTQQSPEKDKFRGWMITLFQIDNPIRDGTIPQWIVLTR